MKIWINGLLRDTNGCDPGLPLVQFLRRYLCLVGTKWNCGGGCTGACTVLVSRWSCRTEAYEHRSISSCTVPLGALHRTHVTTIEGIGTSYSPHPIQRRLVECHVVQCGYDTPGLVMAIYALLVRGQDVSVHDIVKHCDGVFSRCNGYRAVVEAVKSFAGSNSGEKGKLEEKLPEYLKENDKFPLVFKGSSSAVWTTVDRVCDVEELLQVGTKFSYGLPKVGIMEESVIFVNPDGRVNLLNDGISIESNCTLTNIVETLKKSGDVQVKERKNFLNQLINVIENTGTTQWRNSKTFGDAVTDCVEVKMIRKTLVSKTRGKEGSVVDHFFISWLSPDECFSFEKVTSRRANSAPIVLVGLKLKLSSTLVQGCKIFIADEKGEEKETGMIESVMKGREEIFFQYLIAEHFANDKNIILILNLFKKIVAKSSENNDTIAISEVNSTQFEEFVHGENKDDIAPIGKPFPTTSGLICATGEAVFVDDMPTYKNELFLEFVTSSKVHAKIISIDASKALQLDGVTHFISAKDVPNGKNRFRSCGDEDELIFADDTVLFEGHPVGAILAVNENIARKAAMLVNIEYEVMTPLVSIDDAIAANSFYEQQNYLPFKVGEPKEVFEQSEHVIEGEFTTTRQEHFYEETLSSLVVPVNEEGEMKVYMPTPNALMTHIGLAIVLGIPANRITVHVKRIGCNFGGKGMRSLPYIFAVAVAANITKRPVRSVLSRTQDIQMTGQRGEFCGKYKVGVSKGKLSGVDFMLYKNGGWSSDASVGVLLWALLRIDNCYKFPTFHATGLVCRTNTPSNCAFRGFGAPPAFAITENMIFDVTSTLGLDPVQFRRQNFYKTEDTTHFGQTLKEDDLTFEACFEECIRKIDYAKEVESIKEFNACNKDKKQGISVHPFSYGVGIPEGKAGALLNVNLDGSVAIFTGGVEMGQGFYTKMLQIASQNLGIPMNKIYIPESATDKVPNPLLSGGSSTADYCGNAVILACEELNKRLAPIKEAYPKGPWEVWVNMAFGSRINLSVTSYYTSPAEWTNFNVEKKEGNRWAYYVNGASSSIVEIDVLTGEHKLLKTQIVMDAGESINPAIDIGQIEGAFVQGYGYLAMENTNFTPAGELLSKGLESYMAPTIADIPPIFNVALLRKETPPENRRLLYSSKGVGEPPLLSGVSVFFALKTAVVAARKDRGLKGTVDLKAPSNPLNVLEAINRA